MGWREEFKKWGFTRQKAKKSDVEAALRALFGDRVIFTKGGSHQYKIRIPELKGTKDEFKYGFLRISVEGGQHVTFEYLNDIYEAAVLLGLYDPEKD